jgi:putative FmdB family regulatory protein
MPIYEYRCSECGKTFDSIQKFSDEPFTKCGQSNVECPKDGNGAVERLLSTPSFHFKGSGFYITDYNKGSGGAKDAKSPGSTSSSSENKSESKSETKSETKTESKPAASTSSEPSTSAKSG